MQRSATAWEDPAEEVVGLFYNGTRFPRQSRIDSRVRRGLSPDRRGVRGARSDRPTELHWREVTSWRYQTPGVLPTIYVVWRVQCLGQSPKRGDPIAGD